MKDKNAGRRVRGRSVGKTTASQRRAICVSMRTDASTGGEDPRTKSMAQTYVYQRRAFVFASTVL